MTNDYKMTKFKKTKQSTEMLIAKMKRGWANSSNYRFDINWSSGVDKYFDWIHKTLFIIKDLIGIIVCNFKYIMQAEAYINSH